MPNDIGTSDWLAGVLGLWRQAPSSFVNDLPVFLGEIGRSASPLNYKRLSVGVKERKLVATWHAAVRQRALRYNYPEWSGRLRLPVPGRLPLERA